MKGAFHGDAGIKADLLDRLHRHADAGTLIFGATSWNGVQGSPLGVSAESADSTRYAERFGYPLALAGLLDVITAQDRAHAMATTFDWVGCVAPGADLSPVSLRIMEDLLERSGAGQPARDARTAVLDLQRRQQTGETVTRTEWRTLRNRIEAEAEILDGPHRVAVNACALACWPLETSRSVLTSLVSAWIGEPPPPDPDFDRAAQDRADATLAMLWRETAPLRERDEHVHLPTLFKERDPGLARRFEADLARSNTFRDKRAA